MSSETNCVARVVGRPRGGRFAASTWRRPVGSIIFDSAGLDSAWTKSHPAATDGYYAGTGQATASTLGLSGDSYLYLSSGLGSPLGQYESGKT